MLDGPPVARSSIVKREELTMTSRHVRGAFAVSLLTFGMAALVTVPSRAQNTTAIPDEGGRITMVGCFTRGVIGNSSKEKLVLARPIVGSVASVPEATCSASGTDQMIKLQDLKQAKLGDAAVGRWIQIEGRLEGAHKKDGLREVHVKSYTLVPVVVPPPKVAEVIIQQAPVAEAPPAPSPVAEAAPEPAPVATTGERPKLPKTATSLPLVGLIGFVSLASGLAVRLLNRRSLA
jgi:hypothetical protein